MAGGFDLEAWTAGDMSFASSGHQQRSTINQGDPFINTSVLTNQGSSHNASSQSQREGDWICLSCSTVNFAKRTRCNKCGAIKNKRALDSTLTKGDSDIPGKNSGLFKRGDWHCNHCGNINWARRDKCNVCNAMKPSYTQSPRTGRAGGHYDLQDPHDKQQHLSDEESFDEFGRRKKKKKKAITNEKITNIKETSSLPSTSMLSGNPEEDEPPLKLCFPPPPLCYLNGRTASMSSVSSRSCDYTDVDVSEDDKSHS
ncbi:zinc finger Ran-binding domain-containing protein 2-like isoform X2 [Hylaeus volcanicus]|nr:zinc finger Ran-binding domain-containing protein 2-like isoform X2 [Hylaeus volcanicus]